MKTSLDAIKLNFDVAWCKGKASLATLVRNYNAEALGLCYGNFDSVFALLAEFLAIDKV